MASLVVIDDDAGMRNAILWKLRKDGHSVTGFDDAGPALDQVDFSEVDLVVTDLEMPLLGEQFIVILRDRGICVPVIVISGYLNEDRARYLHDLGVHQVLAKPFRIHCLLNRISEMTQTADAC